MKTSTASKARRSAGTAAKPGDTQEHTPAPDPATDNEKSRGGKRTVATGRVSAKPFAFGSEPTPASTALPALDRMNEKLARRLRTVFEAMSRSKLKLAPRPTTVLRYGEWQLEQPDILNLSIFSFLNPTTLAMLSIDPSLIMRMVDARYGGTGATVRAGTHELTSAEEHFAGRLIQAVSEALNESWNEVVQVNFQLKSRETNQTFANIARRDEQVAVISFDIELAGVAAPPLQIVYPLASLRQVERELAAGTKDDVSHSDYVWRLRLRQALGGVRVGARTVLARTEMSMAQVLRLAPGDVIPVTIPAHVPLFVGNRELAVGTVGDHDGCAAIRVERIIK